ncbi:hypothetical protein BCR43DRAFT_499449 [Syncephalastrum racemosum]|uniref:Uncharacterized protein n=1 Tax=Syncephalastrum racemosum TaxID=13706 RepID=A0A1X2H0C6_SYNRA|nr:hypothetical protein BCR43DRAFT_499449 [Syncephalastrum racemosum]
MSYFPSPPSSPSPYEHLDDPDFEISDDEDKVVCGTCNKVLGTDWFCSECHKKCPSCNRFLAVLDDDYCTRCHLSVPSSPPSPVNYHSIQHNKSIHPTKPATGAAAILTSTTTLPSPTSSTSSAAAASSFSSSSSSTPSTSHPPSSTTAAQYSSHYHYPSSYYF